MPRPTKEETEIGRLTFVADFSRLASERFTMEQEGPHHDTYFDEHRGGFTDTNGYYYLNFSKSVWPDGFTEYHIERYSANIFDSTICKTKKDQRKHIREWAFIYPKDTNKVYRGHPGWVIGDWHLQHYSRKNALS